MDEANDVARLRGLGDERAHRVPRGNVDGRHTDVVAGVSHDLGGSVGVDLAPVRQHHVLADPDAPGDRLPDLPGPDDDDVVHGSVSQKSVTLVNVPDQAKLGMQPVTVQRFADVPRDTVPLPP